MEKLKKVISQSKTVLIVIAVLWVILAIVLVSPIACAIVEATNDAGIFNLNTFIQNTISNMVSFTSITKVFSSQYIGTFGTCLIYYTIILIVCSIIGFIKSKPKGDYHNIEHGSSDWSTNGEQYQILTKNKGLILAEDNCLPIDKRGNINTLIVGRIRIR